MTKATSPIPEGFHTVTPHLILNDAGKAIEFYTKAFGAEETCRMPGPGGKVMHAEIKIGNSMLMIADEFPDMGSCGAQTVGGTPVTIHIYVDNVDSAFERAVQAGAKVTMPVADMFWGDRYGRLEDPWGHHWSIGTHTEDLTPEEIGERAQKAFG